ncbi:MAG: hypothetical protein LBU16_10410 [Treponema sp.]|jgi:hypothetical protein|nr:hypothetical protein [Treponema sp.]
MKLFGRAIRYSPEETARVRWEAILGGSGLRRAAKLRCYVVTAGFDLSEEYRITHGLFEVVKMHLVLGFAAFRGHCGEKRALLPPERRPPCHRV